MTVYRDKGGSFLYNYMPSSNAIDKNLSIKFNIDIIDKDITKILFKVENHGDEAKRASEDLGNHTTELNIDALNRYETKTHWETTCYRGLHFMIIEAYAGCKIKSKSKIGVFIQ